ncbi:MAG: ASPIC/UnbV domain-containing protein [Candidatus Latescibacteria bacterium]|nr:ASPIC/UnbV domain-containing protein [Candidatus Latescibacterota bacterium]
MGASAGVDDPGQGGGVAWGDYDSDGDLDLYLSNIGTNRLYQNNGNGTFQQAQAAAGVDDSGDGAGVAWGDYDNDGDLDLYVAKSGSANRLYCNTGVAQNSWLTVKLMGTRSNRDGIGARVIAETGTKQQRRDVDGGAGLFSQSSLPVEFGFGNTATVDELSIRWPSGTVQTLANVATNQSLTVIEPNTPLGNNVPVSPGSGVILEFENITLQGETTVSTTNEVTSTPFKIGDMTLFYDIRTTATFNGLIEVCIPYSQPLNDPSLWHYGTDGGIDGWQSVPLNPDPPPNTVCGNVNSLSPFVVVEKPASTTTVKVEANFVRKGATTANKVPVDGARVVMLPKSAVQSQCNALDANCGWANLTQINTAGDPVMTTVNGSAVVTSSVADSSGWVIYLDIGGATAAGATITGGTTKIGVANGDGALEKKFTNILVADETGLTATAITQRQQRITGSVLEITYPDTVEWDGMDFLYPFIFTSDSEWEVDICGSVPQGYRIVGDPCIQLFLANETKVSFFEVEEIGSPEPHLGLHGQVKHHGRTKALKLEVPGKRKAKGHLKNAENAQVPTAYALHPAYPNPFNPTTQLAYQLPQAGEVELVVYGLTGQKLRVLVQGRQEAGFYQVEWDGRDKAGQSVSSGVYFYRLEAGSFRETRRMVLVR